MTCKKSVTIFCHIPRGYVVPGWYDIMQLKRQTFRTNWLNSGYIALVLAQLRYEPHWFDKLHPTARVLLLLIIDYTSTPQANGQKDRGTKGTISLSIVAANFEKRYSYYTVHSSSTDPRDKRQDLLVLLGYHGFLI